MNRTKKVLSTIIAALFSLLIGTARAQAQTAFTTTTLSAAVTTNNQTLIALTSGTGVAAPVLGAVQTGLFVDGEYMSVLQLQTTTGTRVYVRRGDRGTKAVTHNSGATVYVGGPLFFFDLDPFGSCTRTAQRFLPVPSLQSGNVYDCSPNGWVTFNFQRDNIGTAIASATTIAPTSRITHITGTTAVVNITPPPIFQGGAGCIVLIPDGLFTTTAAGNIALASTAVVSRALTECYDPATAKWYPSY